MLTIIAMAWFLAQTLPPPPPPPPIKEPPPKPPGSIWGPEPPPPAQRVMWKEPRKLTREAAHEALSILPNLDPHKLAPAVPGTPEERVYLADKQSAALLQLNLNPSGGLYTLQSERGDVLVARWLSAEPTATNKQFDRAVWAWDEPWWRSFVIEVEWSLMDSAAAMARYCEGLFQWDNRWRRSLTLRRLESSDDNRDWIEGHFELYERASAQAPLELSLMAVRDGGRAYIIVTVPGIDSVPERFPPLRERITGYSKAQILAEMGGGLHGRLPRYPFARDSILVEELVSRGLLNESEVMDLLTGHADRNAWWYASAVSGRVRILQRVAAARGQFALYAPMIMKFVLNSPAPGSPGGDDSTPGFLDDLDKNNVDAVDWAVALLRQKRCVWHGLSYLEAHAREDRTVRELGELDLRDAVLEARKAEVIAKIRQRVGAQ
jgi:hypothetical protein